MSDKTNSVNYWEVELEQSASESATVGATLRETAERYQIHFSLASDVIYTIDENIIIQSMSPSVERVVGYKPEELVGKSLAELNVIAPEYLQKS